MFNLRPLVMTTHDFLIALRIMVYWILPRAQTDRRDVCGTGVFNFRPLIMPRHILDFVSKFERSENLRYRILD